jgi:hypothetical protein
MSLIWTIMSMESVWHPVQWHWPFRSGLAPAWRLHRDRGSASPSSGAKEIIAASQLELEKFTTTCAVKLSYDLLWSVMICYVFLGHVWFMMSWWQDLCVSIVVSISAWVWEQWCIRSHLSMLNELLLRLQYFPLRNKTCIRRFEKNWEYPKKHLPWSRSSKSQKSFLAVRGSLCRSWQLIQTPTNFGRLVFEQPIPNMWKSDKDPRYKWKTMEN